MRCLAVLVDCTSVTEAGDLFHHMCEVFLTPTETKGFSDHLAVLQNKILGLSENIIENIDGIPDDEDDENIGERLRDTKFLKYFRNISNQTEINTEPTGKENIYSCLQLWEKVLKNHMGLFPFWSGLLLGNLDRFDKEGKQKSSQVNQEKHATNALVENYFGYIKSAIPKGKRLRPAEFLRRQYVDVKGKLAEIEKRHPEVFKYHRRKSIVEEKETWKKRKEKNQSLYFNPPMYLQSPRKKTQADKKSSTAAPQSPTLEATTSQERKRGTHASIAKDPGQIVESSKLQQSEATPTRKRKRITQTLTIDDRGQNVDPSKSQTPEATLIRKRRRVNPSMTAKDQGQNENSSTTQIPATTPTVKKRLTPSETPKYRGKKVEYSKTQPTEAEPILKKKGTPSATSKDPGKNVEFLKSQQPVNKQPQKIRVTRSAYAKDPGQNLDSSKSQLSEAKQTKKIRVTSSLNTKDLAGNEESSKNKTPENKSTPKRRRIALSATTKDTGENVESSKTQPPEPTTNPKRKRFIPTSMTENGGQKVLSPKSEVSEVSKTRKSKRVNSSSITDNKGKTTTTKRESTYSIKTEEEGPKVRSSALDNNNTDSTSLVKKYKDHFADMKSLHMSSIKLDNVPAWGGVSMQGNCEITLSNTCPLDNLLVILHWIMNIHPRIFKEDNVTCNILKECQIFMQNGDWINCKIRWLESMCGYYSGNKRRKVNWNIYGSGYEMIIKHLSGIQGNFQTSTCDEATCPKRTKINESQDVALRWVSSWNADQLWNSPDIKL